MTGLKSKLLARRYLPAHLAQLTELLGRTVVASELMTLEQTEEVRAQSKRLVREPTWQEEIAFADRTGKKFQSLVTRIADPQPTRVFIWTPLSSLCGLLHPVDLHAIDFGFKFDTIVDGIIVIISADLMNAMLLDYYEDNRANKLLCIEVSGAVWGRLAY